MLETALHIGIDHPDFLWIAIPSFLTFVTGLLLGTRSEKIRARMGSESAESAN
ncbi:hypothetical protein [Halovenus sp. HT40]|uniref:hypothetical protein n=1 Tax=Halovenus sp. HT40 TaxID=3126691 RepID=UPI00300ED065